MSDTTTESTAETTTIAVNPISPSPETPVTILPAVNPEAPVKRPRGRPKGSKNKPKPEGHVATPRKARTPKAEVERKIAYQPAQTRPVIPVAAFVAPDDDVVEAEPEAATE